MFARALCVNVLYNIQDWNLNVCVCVCVCVSVSLCVCMYTKDWNLKYHQVKRKGKQEDGYFFPTSDPCSIEEKVSLAEDLVHIEPMCEDRSYNSVDTKHKIIYLVNNLFIVGAEQTAEVTHSCVQKSQKNALVNNFVPF